MAALYPLKQPATGDSSEPHVAVDPMNPRRVAVVATAAGQREPFWCWWTDDAGATWSDAPVHSFDDGLDPFGADPIVAYGTNGELIVAGLTTPRVFWESEVVQENLKRLSETNDTSTWGNALEEENWRRLWASGIPRVDNLAVLRSNGARKWTGAAVRNSIRADREALAVDNEPSSLYCGNAYVAWAERHGAPFKLMFARSRDCGRSFEAPKRLGGRNGFAQPEILVGPNGTVHVLWSHPFRPDPNAGEDAGTGIFHAVSTDGGETFEERGVVVPHGGAALVHMFHAGVAPDGSLLAVWQEADKIPQEQRVQPLQTLRFAHSRDGSEWTQAATLLEPPSDTSQAFPAVAATDDGWHVLFYEANSTRTTVKIASSALNELHFAPAHELASRSFGNQNFYLGFFGLGLGAMMEMVYIGDYVGLAGAGSTLAAAFVLPEGDEWPAPRRAYAWLP
jgi:hypothetical protein